MSEQDGRADQGQAQGRAQGRAQGQGQGQGAVARPVPTAPVFRQTPNAEKYVLEADAMRRRQLRSALLHGSDRTWREHRRIWPALAIGAVVSAVVIAGITVADALEIELFNRRQQEQQQRQQQQEQEQEERLREQEEQQRQQQLEEQERLEGGSPGPSVPTTAPPDQVTPVPTP